MGLFARAGKQNQKAQDYIAHDPKNAEHTNAHCCANGNTGFASLCGLLGIKFTNIDRVAEKPKHHQHIECDKKKLDEFSKAGALWFFQMCAAFWTVKGLFRDFLATLRAVNKGQLSFLLIDRFQPVSRIARFGSSFKSAASIFRMAVPMLQKLVECLKRVCLSYCVSYLPVGLGRGFAIAGSRLFFRGRGVSCV